MKLISMISIKKLCFVKHCFHYSIFIIYKSISKTLKQSILYLLYINILQLQLYHENKITDI